MSMEMIRELTNENLQDAAPALPDDYAPVPDRRRFCEMSDAGLGVPVYGPSAFERGEWVPATDGETWFFLRIVVLVTVLDIVALVSVVLRFAAP